MSAPRDEAASKIVFSHVLVRINFMVALLGEDIVDINLDVGCAQQRKQVDCSQYKKLPPGEERLCHEIYAPICGSDGQTYANECFFCSEVVKTNSKLKFAHFGKC
ncbi:serine protease inhibitor Kazal-type 9-like [Echinops telfairi]|uniref:Serine protease inhibitor Kazal-type 9-like n=1 Tax=Echinops telfairi TaxID=9371 RepID=A0AC55CK80_ECHTE|nr:serine protease inhibitor Kazal-type 9-like [Echinops telfairi]